MEDNSRRVDGRAQWARGRTNGDGTLTVISGGQGQRWQWRRRCRMSRLGSFGLEKLHEDAELGGTTEGRGDGWAA